MFLQEVLGSRNITHEQLAQRSSVTRGAISALAPGQWISTNRWKNYWSRSTLMLVEKIGKESKFWQLFQNTLATLTTHGSFHNLTRPADGFNTRYTQYTRLLYIYNTFFNGFFYILPLPL